MVQINFARREVNCKLVFYGPGLSGKTTNLEIIHKKAPDQSKGQLTSIATEQDRTLFFDFLPLDLGSVAGMRTKIFLYTVPGQVYYDSTRKLVLQGVDGVVFVADSGPDRLQDNIDSFNNLITNLKDYNLELGKIPCVIQYNKRDLPGALPLEQLHKALNPNGVHPETEAVAVKGDGVMLTLKLLSKIVIERLNDEYGPNRKSVGAKSAVQQAAARPAPAAPARPAASPRVAPRPPVAAPKAPAVAAKAAPKAPPPQAPPKAPAVAAKAAPQAPPKAPSMPGRVPGRPQVPARPQTTVRPASGGGGAPGRPPATRPPATRPPVTRPPAVRPPSSRPTAVRPAPSPPAKKSKAWLWVLIVIILLGGGAAAVGKFVMHWF